MVGVSSSSLLMPTIFKEPQSKDWGFLLPVISRVCEGFKGNLVLTLFSFGAHNFGLIFLCAQIVPILCLGCFLNR